MSRHKVLQELEDSVDGFTGLFGGEELRRASAALAGPRMLAGDKPSVEVEAGFPTLAAPRLSSPLLEEVAASDVRVRELFLSAKKYATSFAADPQNMDAAYNHGLVLQELAARIGGGGSQHMRLLQEACGKYEAALAIRPSFHAAHYNWGVALSDIARLLKQRDPDASERYLRLASQKYAASLDWNPNNPQALNNWGLVLQELITMLPATKREQCIQHSIQKFRSAIRLRPDFDRGCYNLGTVYYTHACTLHHEALTISSAPEIDTHLDVEPRTPQDAAIAREVRHGAEAALALEARSKRMFTYAAQYIALAYTLMPLKEIYKRSLSIVHSMLPLPYIMQGLLQAADLETIRTDAETWRTHRFVLSVDGLRSVYDSTDPTPYPAGGSPTAMGPLGEYHVPLHEVTMVKECDDPSLPPGPAFWVCTTKHPQGLYFVAELDDDAALWVDALQLAAHAHSMGHAETLRDVLATPRPA